MIRIAELVLGPFNETFSLDRHLDYGWLLAVIAALTAAAIVLPSFRAGAAVAALALVALEVSAQRTSWDEMLLYLGYTSFQSPGKLGEAQRERTLADRFKGPEDVFAISWIDGKPFFFINGSISVGLTSPAERVVGGLSSMMSPRLDRALVLGMGTRATAGVVGSYANIASRERISIGLRRRSTPRPATRWRVASETSPVMTTIRIEGSNLRMCRIVS